eukprot:COSAG04_NODE_4073_length_2321_cov_2.063456_1_plen_226_part_00
MRSSSEISALSFSTIASCASLSVSPRAFFLARNCSSAAGLLVVTAPPWCAILRSTAAPAFTAVSHDTASQRGTQHCHHRTAIAALPSQRGTQRYPHHGTRAADGTQHGRTTGTAAHTAAITGGAYFRRAVSRAISAHRGILFTAGAAGGSGALMWLSDTTLGLAAMLSPEYGGTPGEHHSPEQEEVLVALQPGPCWMAHARPPMAPGWRDDFRAWALGPSMSILE